MLKRIFKDAIQFLGLTCLLGIGTFGFYMAMAAYQLCQLERDCPLYRFQEPQPTSLEYQNPKSEANK